MSETTISETTASPLLLPRIRAWPDRGRQKVHAFDRWVASVTAIAVARASRLRGRSAMMIVPAVEAHGKQLSSLDDSALRARADALRVTLRRKPLDPNDIARGFALVREAAARTIGQRHYPVQLAGGWAMMQGMIAEMQPGEGKTLTATLAASVAAMGGAPVHVVTVNDYLARRDAEAMGPVYRFLGLSVGLISNGQSAAERRQAYAADIVYVTNKELVFDYLRDKIAGRNSFGVREAIRDFLKPVDSKPRLRGLGWAIVDEADSVLIDEARTPLIIGSEGSRSAAADDLNLALADVRPLVQGVDFSLVRGQRRAEIRNATLLRLNQRARSRSGRWQIPTWREEHWSQALVALHLCRPDVDYLVRDGRVEIIDEFTGRVLPGRSWGAGLHQLVELKEGCQRTDRGLDAARVTYQRFFTRYRRLAGLSATAREASQELWTVYRLSVACLPTHRPLRRQRLRTTVVPAKRKWTEIASATERRHASGQPVLVATRTLASSLEASAALTKVGLQHRLLNAAEDHAEAEIISHAGEMGQITIATNMAGRGADIPLGPGVAELGGLHVIVSELHEARRIDRQLFGRCARHGEPGSFQLVLGDDDALALNWPRWLRKAFGRRSVHFLMRLAQRNIEARNARLRRRLLQMEDTLDDVLAFSGARE
ncbi:MAG: prepilin peptidase [Hyphomicrobiales bacterium]|nr:prepilin peptidase [Hyphomicrobiales bacterium]